MKKILFDMSSVLWTNLLAGKDKEGGREEAWPDDAEKKPIWVNSAEFGFENFVANLGAILKRHDAAPRDIVMVFDGRESKMLRQQIFPGYKAGRDHHPAYYEEFDKLRVKARQALLDLGAIACEQQAREADDVLAYLAQNLRFPHTIITNDGDMLAVVGGYTSVDRDGTINENKYGMFPPKYITLYKALCGDSSDKYGGAKGFGPKAFIDLLCTFREPGLENLCDLIRGKKIEELAEDVAEFPRLQKIIDSKADVYMCWELARFYPEKVNTARTPLQITAGKLVAFNPKEHDARLKEWYGQQRIISPKTCHQAAEFAKVHMPAGDHVSLDIETSTPPESDAWLAEKKGAEEGDTDLGVDMFGSELTGLSLTFGKNMQYSFYLPADHVETEQDKNLSVEQVRDFVGLIPKDKATVVWNSVFELTILHQEWGADWADNGFHGFLPNVDDAMFMKSYVDENTSLRLKKSSKSILGYDQVDYETVTQGRKMNQMTAAEVVDYGNDDTICTSALHNYLRFVMELENTWQVYRDVEIGPMYLNAKRFLDGTAFSLQHMMSLQREDQAQFDKAWSTVRAYLFSKGWEGTVCPEFETVEDLTPARIKEAYAIVVGEELKTLVRTPDKLVRLVEQGSPELAVMLTAAFGGALTNLNALVKAHFKGDAVLDINSPPALGRLLYETMALPIRLRNKPTDVMRAKGIREGNPKADNLAIEFALKYDAETHADVMPVLKALQSMKSVSTKQGLYYKPYCFARHWKDDKIHAGVLQCRAATRRYSSADPNLQQLPKHPKQGVPARFRETYVPHQRRAVVVSLDFSGQELRTIADRSQDPNMLACYAGDNKKDMHSLTAIGIMINKTAEDLARMIAMPAGDNPVFQAAMARWSQYDYDRFAAAADDKANPDNALAKILRALGKKTNFTTEYGAQAPKLAETLIIPVEEAAAYIAAKSAAFPRAEAWKKEVIAQAHKLGYASTMLGGRRHLPALLESDKFAALRAERQAVNFEIQGSCAEMTKQAEGRIWFSDVLYRYDAVYIGPIHDEVVFSVTVDNLIPFLTEVHDLMTSGYAGMQVPIVSSISFGQNFGEQIEVGETVDPVAVNKALAKIGYGERALAAA